MSLTSSGGRKHGSLELMGGDIVRSVNNEIYIDRKFKFGSSTLIVFETNLGDLFATEESHGSGEWKRKEFIGFHVSGHVIQRPDAIMERSQILQSFQHFGFHVQVNVQ